MKINDLFASAVPFTFPHQLILLMVHFDVYDAVVVSSSRFMDIFFSECYIYSDFVVRCSVQVADIGCLYLGIWWLMCILKVLFYFILFCFMNWEVVIWHYVAFIFSVQYLFNLLSHDWGRKPLGKRFRVAMIEIICSR